MAKSWLRWTGYSLGAIVCLIVIAVGGVFVYSSLHLSHQFDIEAPPVSVVANEATVNHGYHLATAIGKCSECHGEDLGGRVFMDDPALGRVVATNLTSGQGGVIHHYTDDALLARAIRRGVRHDGRGLILMPSEDYVYFSDEDIAALIAYLRSLPAVDRSLPHSDIKLLGRVLYTTGALPLLKAEVIPRDIVPPQVTPSSPLELGQYLANVGGCTGCHGPGLSGGKIPGAPPDWKPATNITPAALGSWTEEDFRRSMKEGVRPNGTPIDPIMPWKLAGRMSDQEMHALWVYLQSVPSKEYGNR